eukprot:6691877-Pyramimonas_sp.AAC.1
MASMRRRRTRMECTPKQAPYTLSLGRGAEQGTEWNGVEMDTVPLAPRAAPLTPTPIRPQPF